MAIEKLDINDDLKLHINKLREILAGNSDELSQPEAAQGCGAYCKITCAYYCRSACEGNCTAKCSDLAAAGCTLRMIFPI